MGMLKGQEVDAQSVLLCSCPEKKAGTPSYGASERGFRRELILERMCPITRDAIRGKRRSWCKLDSGKKLKSGNSETENWLNCLVTDLLDSL